MKKMILGTMAICLMVLSVSAQSDKYMKAMEEKVNQLDTVRSLGTWQSMANSFERIGEAEKTQWLPFYYAALSNVMAGYMSMTPGGQNNTTQLDMLADKSDALIAKAEALEKNNSEIWCVKKMIATLRMNVDPMSRWQTYGPAASEALEKAKSLDANNPRVFLLEGQDKFYTPEQFGGSKAEARKLFDEAERKYGTQSPKTPIHPRWGLNQVKYFQTLAK